MSTECINTQKFINQRKKNECNGEILEKNFSLATVFSKTKIFKHKRVKYIIRKNSLFIT